MNLDDAELELGVVNGAGGMATIRVDGLVVWTAPRPAAEIVLAKDHVVIVAAMHFDGSVARRVVVTEPSRVRELARIFNALRVAPPGAVRNCYNIGPSALKYRVAFAASSTARPDVVATIAACSDLAVVLNGKPSASLQVSGFADAVAHAIGVPHLHLG